MLTRSRLALVALITILLTAIAAPIPASAGGGYFYRAHVKDKGWLPMVWDGQTAGTTGESRRLEAVDFIFLGQRASAHVKDKGWLAPVTGPGIVGTTGESRRLEAVRVSSTLPWIEIECQAHVAGLGWLPRVRDGEVCGTVGQSRQAEAFRFWIVDRS